MKGKVCIITGANTGIGRVTALELARMGAHVILACRSEAKAREAADDIIAQTGNPQVEVMALDLGSFDSVRAFADAFLARDLPLDVLVNNAGLAGQRGLTADGFELTFGVNHLGPFLLTLLLIDKLKAAAPSRIINVASRAHERVKAIDYDAMRRTTATTTGFPEYKVSKLANVLFTVELARRLEGTDVFTCALHPGVVASDIWRRIPGLFQPLVKLFMVSNEEGARASIMCASDPTIPQAGHLYYHETRPKAPNPVVHNRDMALELWRRSAEWTGVDLPMP